MSAGPAGLSSTAGPILLNYNGGAVILGQTHIYYIWYGDWSVDSNAAPILNALANNLVGVPVLQYFDPVLANPRRQHIQLGRFKRQH